MKQTPLDPRDPHPIGDEEEIAALFRSAGPGERVADADLPPIKAMAREAWRRQVRRTAARRRMALAALAIAAAVVLTIAVALMRRAANAPVVTVAAATLEAVVGDARLDSGNAAAGAEVASGATLTTGDSGRVALRLGDGHSVRVDVASSVRLLSGRSLRLDRGAVYVESGASLAGATVEIETPLGVVTDIGTRFEVRLLAAGATGGAPLGAATESALAVRVRDGAVRLSTGAATYDAAAGDELRLGAGGELERVAATSYGDDWRWVERVRPPLEIEGITCEAFIGWAARESGRRWRWADAAGDSGAAGALVHGSIDGFSVDEALETVLPSCGLSHRVEGDSLVIESDGG